MKNIKSAAITVLFIISGFTMALADPMITSVTMVPANPTFGDAVQITVNYCAQLYNSAYIAVAFSSQAAKVSADLSGAGQVFVVSGAGVDVATSQPAPSPGGAIGWMANANPGGGVSDCTDCGANSGKSFTQVYNVHVPPASYFPGCNLSNIHLYVGMKDATLNSGDWAVRPACSCEPAPITWVIGTMAKGFNIADRTEGVIQNQNDLLLYSVDYSYWNGQLKITDIIPGNGELTLVSWGPQTIAGGTCSAPVIGSTAGNFTWNMADRTGLPGSAVGTVWMLFKSNQNAPVAGTHYTNATQGTMTGVSTWNASSTNTVGQAAMTIMQSQSESNPNYGDMLTYFLTYNVNGYALVGYQAFDDIAGTYGNDNTPPSGAAIPGWSFWPQANTNGGWTVADQCNTGDDVITGHAIAGNSFPNILYNGITNPNNMCSGILETDVYIDPAGYEGSDALVIIRGDGQANGNFYSLALSVDNFIGTNDTGHVGFQRCNSVEGCEWPLSNNCCIVTSDKWYRVKIQIDPMNQYHFQAKVWAKGDPEPSGWGIDWTDPSPNAVEDSCTNGQNWRPGLGEEHGASGDTRDSYNNFLVYLPRTSVNTILWDTVPNNSNNDITYVGQQGPHPYSGNSSVASWNLGNITNESGTFTWWGTVNTCGPITNVALINGAAPEVAAMSNQLVAFPVCVTQTGSPTFTKTWTASPTITVFGTSTFTMTPAMTGTNTLTDTPTATITITGLFTTPTFTSTPSQTPLPPVLTLLKSASKTSGIVNGDDISFNMHICNTGGAISSGTMTLTDDYTSATDDWIYNGPYFISNPVPGINYIMANSTGNVATYTIVFQAPGFTGCVDVPMDLKLFLDPVQCSWSNIAILNTGGWGVNPVSTVVMSNNCTTPTFTATVTATTAPSTMQLSKSVFPAYANNGDNLSYVLSYTNASGATVTAYTITDDLSGYALNTQIQFLSSIPAPTTSAGSIYTWNLGTIPPGGSGNVIFLAKVIGTDTTLMTICNRASDSTGNLTGFACLWEFTATATLTQTQGIFTKTFTPTFTPTFTITRTYLTTFSMTPTNTVTPSATQTIFAAGTLSPTNTMTATVIITPATPAPTPAMTSTPTACCTGTVVCDGTPAVVTVLAKYNQQGSNGNVDIVIMSTIPFILAPDVAVKPHNHAVQDFTATFIPVTNSYQVIYPAQNGYGDIDTIKVTYADACGNSGTTDGSYKKVSDLSSVEHRVFRNVINPDHGERTRVLYNVYGPGKSKIRVFNQRGVLIKVLFDGNVDGSKDQEECTWDGLNTAGKAVASGTYVIIIETDSYTAKAKIAVIR